MVKSPFTPLIVIDDPLSIVWTVPPSFSPPGAMPVTVVEVPTSFSKTSPVWSPLSSS